LFQGRDKDSKRFVSTKLLRAKDKLFFIFCLSMGIISITLLCYIIIDIIIKGGMAIKFNYLIEVESLLGQEGGFLNAIVGSLLLVLCSIIIALPLSFGTAVYLSEYSAKSSRIAQMINMAIGVLSSTPSIVFGVFGFTLFVIYLEFGFSLLAGGITLAIMIIPLIFVSSYESLKSVNDSIRDASYALGASRWQTIRNSVVPVALASIISGVIISVGRAIGETAAVLLTAGYASYVCSSILDAAASMPVMIYQFYDIGVTYPIVQEKVYSLAFFLIMIVLILNLVSRWIGRKSDTF